jgi:tRNA-dihydrouridine synthase B
MKIGNIELKHGILLAPMAGITDHAFRTICKEFGAEYMATEMISAKGLHYNSEKTMSLTKIYDGERPMAVQLFGSDPLILAESAYRLAVSDNRPDVIDINMGCPMQKITNNGDGSALLKNPALAAECIKAVVDIVKPLNIPVTVKIRSGWSSEQINAVEIARSAEQAGADMICIHGRTRTQLYSPPVDLKIIKQVKDSVSIPVVGNGGLLSCDDVVEMFRETGCDGVMIARGALGNPWLLREITAKMDNTDYEPPSIIERLQVMRRHIELLAQDKGEIIGVKESRKHIAWYMKGMPNSTHVKNTVNSTTSLDEINDVIDRYVSEFG